MRVWNLRWIRQREKKQDHRKGNDIFNCLIMMSFWDIKGDREGPERDWTFQSPPGIGLRSPGDSHYDLRSHGWCSSDPSIQLRHSNSRECETLEILSRSVSGKYSASNAGPDPNKISHRLLSLAKWLGSSGWQCEPRERNRKNVRFAPAPILTQSKIFPRSRL